ncbi:MAG: hypothetical protein AAF558_07745, partial [Verrucomicrobiota bacterium]
MDIVEIKPPAPRKKFGSLVALPFLVSVIIHGTIFLLIGSAIIFEGRIPQNLFDSFDSETLSVGAEETAPPLMEEEFLEEPIPLEMPEDEALDVIEESSPMETSLDVITVDASISEATAFQFTAQGLGMDSSDLLTKGVSVKKNRITPQGKGMKFDTASRATSSVNFFNIKQKASRIVVAVDVSRSMVEDKRGGLNGYATLKQQVGKIVDSLNSGTAFNIVMFANTVDIFTPNFNPATETFKTDAKQFLEPYMSDFRSAKNGNLKRNYKPSSEDLVIGRSGSTRMDLAITAAFELGADAIFIISDGAPAVKRKVTPEFLADFERARKALTDAEKGRIEVEDAQRIVKDAGYDPDLVKERIEWFLKNGEKLKAYRDKVKKEQVLREGGIMAPPGISLPSLRKQEMVDLIEDLYKKLYKAQGRKKPVIHCVGYQTSD